MESIVEYFSKQSQWKKYIHTHTPTHRNINFSVKTSTLVSSWPKWPETEDMFLGFHVPQITSRNDEYEGYLMWMSHLFQILAEKRNGVFFQLIHYFGTKISFFLWVGSTDKIGAKSFKTAICLKWRRWITPLGTDNIPSQNGFEPRVLLLQRLDLLVFWRVVSVPSIPSGPSSVALLVSWMTCIPRQEVDQIRSKVFRVRRVVNFGDEQSLLTPEK